VEKVNFYGIMMNVLESTQFLLKCNEYLAGDKHRNIFFINAHCFNIAYHSSTYKEALNTCDLLLNDGIGIKLGAMFRGIKMKENMCGTDIIPKLLTLASNQGKNIYLLGGKENTAQLAKRKLEEGIPGISIVGCRNGYFDVNQSKPIIDDIIKRKTDILVVGMGVPRQELWLSNNKEELQGIKISIAGGAILDFISQTVYRAPLWMRKIGMEWLFRLLQEPVRLFKRYFLGIPLFFYLIFKLRWQ
jgi:N-acetylglucosaminyldiphosphoundecaprenol N-acetyl-beta-D-mannosaminyltransferase